MSRRSPGQCPKAACAAPARTGASSFGGLLVRGLSELPKDLVAGPIGENSPPVDDDQPIDDRQHLVTMRRHDQRLFGRQRTLQMLDEIGLGLRVHRAGRLIEEQQLAYAY